MKKNKLHNFQGKKKKKSKDVDKQFCIWFFSFLFLGRNLTANYGSQKSLIFKLFKNAIYRCLALIYVKVKAPLNK